MRRFVAAVAALGAVAAVVSVAIGYWHRNPRVGTHFVNEIVNPLILRRGLAGGDRSEIGTIEHVGRKSGTRRLTPVHPEPTTDGFRIIVPLGSHSEWARNVISAGHCRLQVHETVFDLDEPAIVPAAEVPDLPRVVRWVMGALGFEYLKLHVFDANPGSLEPVQPAESIVEASEPEPALTGASVAGAGEPR